MKVSNAELMNVKVPLQELAKVKLPIKTSLDVLKLIQKLNEFLVPVEQVQNNLIKQYGHPEVDAPKSGRVVILPGDDNFPKFAEELAELVGQENEIVFTKVKLPETMEIEPGVLMALEKFVTV